MPRPNPTFRVLVFYAVVVTAALLLVLGRPLRGPGLSRSEVRQEEGRLAALARQTRIEAPRHGGPLHVTWSPAPGGYRGLAIRPQWHRAAADAGPEIHLSVRLAITDGALLRSPARASLASATLYREPWATDLVPRRDPARLILIVEPVAGASASDADAPEASAAENAAAGAELAVDNVLRDSGGEAASSAGRAWARLAAPAPSRAAPRTLQILAVLARTLRGRICDDPADGSTCRSTALTLAPSRRANRYRITLMELGGGPGTIAFELEVTAGDERLVQGLLRPLANPSLSRPADLLVVPPRGSGGVVTSEDSGLVVAGWRPGDRQWPTRRWTIDFSALLEGSAW